MGDVLAVGMIGAGGIARSHLEAIAECDSIRVAAVMDTDSERAHAAAAEFGGSHYGELDGILGDPQVEAVHVCTPHNLHADQVVAAAKAGKHVLVEKPMALSLADCDRMIEACDLAEKVLMVGQVMRYYPVNLKVKELIGDGAIGEVGHMMRRRYSYFSPLGPGQPSWYLDQQTGGNCVLYCFGPHEYDILPWYLDSAVTRVYAQGSESTELYRGQQDSYTALMTHASGAVSVLSQSVVCRPGAHDQFIIGSDGSMMLTNSKLVLNGEEVPIDSSLGGMGRQLREFARCCLEGGEPDASGHSVRHTMAVIEAVQLSAERAEPIEVDGAGSGCQLAT
ncbi:MAG: hypothetical protein CME15_15750 [Gemmatimonadetes bacterium]|nr:hypothetical protein [Gemmatimonadota bacterium]